MAVDLYNTRKRYAVIESLDLMRNISQDQGYIQEKIQTDRTRKTAWLAKS